MRYLLFFCLLTGLFACDPYQDEDIALGPLPDEPAFSVRVWEEDPNYVIVEDESVNTFARAWSFPGGIPDRSTQAVDTILYRNAGTYTITLDVATSTGAGNARSTQTVVIENDAETPCSDELTLLAGGCEDTSVKCWTFSRIAGAVTVGPSPGSGEWFTSNADGLQDQQYDDQFCFYFAGGSFLYMNNGETIDPWNGYVPVPYDPPTDHTYTLIPGGGENGELRIELTEGSFMGLWDASNIYDVVTLTEDELVVRTPFLDPAASGWFELYFVAN